MGEIGRRYPVDREKTTVHSISDRLLCDKLDKTERTWNGIVPYSQEIRDAMPTRRTRCRTTGGGHLKRSPFFLGSSRGRTTCRTVSVGPRRGARRRRRNGKIEQSVGVPVDNQRKCFFSPSPSGFPVGSAPHSFVFRAIRHTEPYDGVRGRIRRMYGRHGETEVWP